MIVFLTGLVLFICGVVIIVKPIFYNSTYAMTFDFSDLKYPLGGAFIVAGAYYIYKAAKLQDPEFQSIYWICPQCQEILVLTEEIQHRCKQCDVEMEKLDGFYDRHPDLHV